MPHQPAEHPKTANYHNFFWATGSSIIQLCAIQSLIIQFTSEISGSATQSGVSKSWSFGFGKLDPINYLNEGLIAIQTSFAIPLIVAIFTALWVVTRNVHVIIALTA